jgi:hypothetical protein
MWKCCVLVSVCIICGLFLTAVSEAQDEPEKTPYELVMEKLETLVPGDAIDVRMGTEKDEYNLDEPFEVRFQVSEDCYIVLMDIGAATQKEDELVYGDITFLIPSFKLTENKVEGGRVYSTLYDFDLPIKVAPPDGYETVNLFCSPEKLDLFDADFDTEKVYTVTPDDTEKLQKLLERLERLEKQEWAGSSVSFLIRDPEKGITRGVKKFGALPPIGATGTTGKFFPPIGATGTTGKQ